MSMAEMTNKRMIERLRRDVAAEKGVSLYGNFDVIDVEAALTRIDELEAAVTLDGPKPRGPFCSTECLGQCEGCKNETRKITAMKSMLADPICRAAIEKARKGE